MNDGFCPECKKPTATFKLVDEKWLCRSCAGSWEPLGCRLFEYGVENPMDPKGSTAHVRDIKARRLDPKTKKLFYYQPPKTYFFSK